MRKFWSHLFSGGAPALFACLLLGLTLIVQYSAGLMTVAMAKISKEIGLNEHLEDLGKLAPPLLGKAALSITDLVFDAQWQENQQTADTTQTTALQFFKTGLENDLTEPFVRFVREARLTKAVLIAEDGRVLFDTLDPEHALEHYDFWEIDQSWIAQALKGAAKVTPFYKGPQGRPIKRFYQPVADSSGAGNGKVRAVLCLVAGENYLDGIRVLGRSLIRLNLLLTLLMAGVGLIIFSLIRRQRRYERQVAETDRLAGLGSLAAGFAHELRNPLEIIRAFTEDLEHSLRRGAPSGEAIEACQEIIEEVDRMNRLVGQFLSYSRGQAEGGIGGTTPLIETIQSVLMMLRPSADKACLTLILAHPGATTAIARRWAVGLDSGAFRQVLLNLILNAIQSSPEGRAVTITIAAGARQIELRVQDEGPGIPEKERHRIFEPFFSTRPGGSGLGLAISRQIADRSGGSLKLNPGKPGQGACFALILPRAKDVEIKETFMPASMAP